MLDSPRHRRILVLLLLAFGLSAWFWADPILAWSRLYKDDIQTLAALIGLPLAVIGLVATVLQWWSKDIGAWATEQARIAERDAREKLLGLVGNEVK